MIAIILAGGLGTRLKTVVHDIPKPMAPINSKPFLEYLVTYLERNNVSNIILSVGYKSEIIEAYFGHRFNNTEISYSFQIPPLGTGGAMKHAFEECLSDSVFVLNGDSFFGVDLSELKQCHSQSNADITIALKQMNNADRYGVVEVDKGRVHSFLEKGKKDCGYINGGVYCVKTDIFDDYNLPDIFSFEHFLEDNSVDLKVFGFPSSSDFIDIGIPEDYSNAQELLPKWVLL